MARSSMGVTSTQEFTLAVIRDRHTDVPDDQGRVSVALPRHGKTDQVADAPVPPGPVPGPDHTHMSRWAGELSVKIPRRPRQGPTHVVVDSTDLKIFGEGEWAEAA